MANYVFTNDALAAGSGNYNMVPTKIVEKQLLSDTSEAYTCFTQQRLSNKLQAYLINYVISISGQYSTYV